MIGSMFVHCNIHSMLSFEHIEFLWGLALLVNSIGAHLHYGASLETKTKYNRRRRAGEPPYF